MKISFEFLEQGHVQLSQSAYCQPVPRENHQLTKLLTNFNFFFFTTMLSINNLIIPPLPEWWVYWNTLVRPSVPKRCVRNWSFVFCWILFIFGILVGHDLSMHILYRFHGWLIFARVIALFMFVWPYVRQHILCTQLVICLLLDFIHIWHRGWP